MDNHHLRNSEEDLRQEAELRAIGRTFQDVEHRKRWLDGEHVALPGRVQR